MNAVAQALNKTAIARSESTKIEQSRAIAEVQAMVVVASQKPRDRMKALEAVRETCGIQAVAERAFWKFPRGGQSLKGESIHLARELARCWGNIDYGIKELSRDDGAGVSEMLAFAWDVETNTRAETVFIVPHLRDKKGGPERLTDVRDVYELNANMGARRVREQIFAVLPPWLIEEAVATCHKTLTEGQSEPLPKRIEMAAKTLADMKIGKDRVEAKFGKKLSEFEADDVAQLGVSLRSIKRGEISADDEFPSTAGGKVADALNGGGKTPEPAPADSAAAEPENAAAAALINAISEAANPKAVAGIMDREQVTLAALYTEDKAAHGQVVAAARAKGWAG